MTRRSLMLFALLSILWGVPYLVIKIVVAEVSVPFLVFSRSLTGALALLPFAFPAAARAELAKRWLAVLAFAIAEMVVPWGLIAHGELTVPSSTAGLLVALTPLVTVLLARLTGTGTDINARRMCGLGVGFAGVFILAAPTRGASILAIAEIVLAAVCYAVGAIIATRSLSKLPAMTLTAASLICTAAFYAIPASMAWPETMPSAAALHRNRVCRLLCPHA
jgi:drug/metabolite transporter (DMT)-like permease